MLMFSEKILNRQKIMLRCELFADGSGLWKNVPVHNLSDSRQPEGSGKEYFAIPADETCWIMLSDIKLSSKRLQNIIVQLEEKGACSRVTPLCHKLLEIQDIIKAGKDIPPEKYTESREYENIIVKDSMITVVLTDYMEQGKELQTKCEDFRLGINNFLGRTTNSSSDRLKYLVCSTADARDKWNCLKTEGNGKDLEKNYTDFLKKQAVLSCVAECFAYWITKPQFSEVMYDGLYGCSAGMYEKSYEGLYNTYYTIIKYAAEYPSTLKILSEYSEMAINNYESALSLKNGGKDVSGYWDIAENTSRFINDNFKLLELYTTLNETPCFLVEVLYPQAKNIHEISLKILDCFAKPVVWAGGKRFGTHVPHYLVKVLKKMTKEKRLTVTEYTDLRIQWKFQGEKAGKISVVTIKGTVEENESTASKILNSKIMDGLGRAMAALDVQLAVYAILKDGLSSSNTLSLIKSVLDFTETWNLLNGKKGMYGLAAGEIFSRLEYSMILDFAITAIDCAELIKTGDTDAALVKGGGKAAIAALTFYFAASPEAVLILVLAGIGVDILAKQLTDDDFSRWLKYGTYGKKYLQCRGTEWTVFSGKYLETKDRWGDTDIQIRTFYRITFDYDICDAKIWYFNDNEGFTNYRFVELHLKLKMLASDTILKVEVVCVKNKKERILSSIQLTSTNSYVRKVSDGCEIFTYLYYDHTALTEYLAENRGGQAGKKYPYTPEMVSYPKPEKYNINDSLLFDSRPELRVRVTEQQPGTTGQMEIKKEAEINFNVLNIRRA